MLTRKYYPQKSMDNKNCKDYHEMLYAKEQNWNNLPTYLKRGRCVIKRKETVEINNEHFKGEIIRNNWNIDLDIPTFKDNREYILNTINDITKPASE